MAKCLTPFIKQDENKVWQKFPCGQCLMCTKARASGWSFRLVKEGERSSLSLFVTLTYNTDHVPITEKGFMSLDKDRKITNPKYEKQMEAFRNGKRKTEPKRIITEGSHLTKFFKRLRKKSPNIRYYAVGEYGSKTWRPHYHIILFNADIQSVLDSWKLGEVHFGNVSEASIGYTLKYISKEGKVPQHKNDDRIPEYSRMSKGLGDNYITDKTRKWHLDDIEKRMYLPLQDGKKAPMARYYKDRIYNKQERGYLKGVMEKLALEMEEQERLHLGENYDHILAERVKINQLKMKKNAKTDKL